MAVIDANYKQAFDILGKKYEEIHPDVSVNVQVIPGDGYATWIRAAIAGGEQTAPDIFNINMTSGYFESGKAISLKPYLLSTNPYTGKTWMESFHREYMEMMRSGSDYPQVPLNFVEIGFFYNQGIFTKLGIKPPDTWEEFMGICQKIQNTGYIPISIGGDMDSYWAGTVGWIVRVFGDACFFDLVPKVMARKGDYSYDPDTDGAYKLDYNDPYCDLLVNIPSERTLQAILDGELRMDGPRMRELYVRLKEFAQFWQKGYNGANYAIAYQMFLTQKSAIILAASPSVLGLDYDMKDLEPGARFNWGIFRVPSIASSDLVKIKTRGAGGPLPVYGIIRKTREQQDLAADFLMFVMNPKSCQTIIEETIKDEQPLVGPFAIKDVPLPEGMKERYDPFFGLGREKINFRGLMDEQESVWRWCIIAQDYMAGKMEIDDFLKQYQQIMVQAIPRVIKMQRLDMDPRTRDNNESVIIEIEGILDRMKSGKPDRETDPSFLKKKIAKELKELARFTETPESKMFDLIVEKTFPIKITDERSEFEEWNKKAGKLCHEEGFQYIIVILFTPEYFDYKFHNFRPSPEEVVKNLHGKRYSQKELRKILHLD